MSVGPGYVGPSFPDVRDAGGGHYRQRKGSITARGPEMQGDPCCQRACHCQRVHGAKGPALPRSPSMPTCQGTRCFSDLLLPGACYCQMARADGGSECHCHGPYSQRARHFQGPALAGRCPYCQEHRVSGNPSCQVVCYSQGSRLPRPPTRQPRGPGPPRVRLCQGPMPHGAHYCHGPWP